MLLNEYFDLISEPNSKAGGGSVAASNGALACSLVKKAYNMILKKEQNFSSISENYIYKLDEICSNFKIAILEDGKAFNCVLKAYKLPKETEEDKFLRNTSIQEAFKIALQSPLNMYLDFQSLEEIIEIVAMYTDDMSYSEIEVAKSQISAGKASAKVNILLNLAYIKDEQYKIEILDKIN